MIVAGGGLVALLGLLALVGWAADLTVLRAGGPTLEAMKPWTAIALVLLAAATLVAAARPAAHRTVLALAALGGLVGIRVLVTYATGFGGSLDTLLFHDAVLAEGGLRPGRMAQMTAATVTATAAALVLRGIGHRRPAHWVAMGSLVVAALALTGHVYGVESFRRVGPHSSVAMLSAVCLVLLNFAVVWLLPEHGLLALARSTPGTRMLIRRALLPAVIAPGLIGWLVLAGLRAGWYESAAAVAAMAVAGATIVGAVLWFSARAVASFERALLEAFSEVSGDRDELRGVVSDREAALAETEAIQRASLESLEQGVALFDLTGKVLLLNQAGKELVGYDADELTELFQGGQWETYREDGSVLPVDERPLAITTREGRAVRGAIVRWRHRDGRLPLLRVSTQVVRDPDGEVTGVVTAFADITTTREAELLLLESEARFSALVERSNDVICVVDRTSHITYISPAGERLFGELVRASGRPFDFLLHPDDRDEVMALFVELLGDPGGHRTASFRVLAAQGKWRYVEASATNRLDDPAVGGIVANLRDVSERAEAEDQLRHQAFHDPLTGLANRALLLDRMRSAVNRAASGEATPGLLFIDLDRFKAVNDTMGHDSGDELLRIIAARIDSCIRAGDTLARIGGDEFVVLADDIRDRQEAVTLADRILKAVEAPVGLATGLARVSASIGIALDLDHDPDSFLRAADTALYQAKANGRNRYAVADLRVDGPTLRPDRRHSAIR